MRRPFLTAEWERLLLLSFTVDPAALEPLRPAGTELDGHDGRSYLSLVGFRFARTRVRGLAIPFHTRFPEVNLRFYVRRLGPEGWRRGVVFVKEIVPRRAIAWLARVLYNEPYAALPMRQEGGANGGAVSGARVGYSWKTGGRWHAVSGQAAVAGALPAPGSLEEFITEHYWGYTRQRDGGTLEYRVEHPRWQAFACMDVRLELDAAAVYGPRLAPFLLAPPHSALIADGSAVRVHPGEPVA